MTCHLMNWPESDAGHVIKVGSRLGLEKVVINDPGMLPEHCVLTKEWFESDEATGSYLWADLLNGENNAHGQWVQRWRGRVYYFTDRHTAFAFKMRFG